MNLGEKEAERSEGRGRQKEGGIEKEVLLKVQAGWWCIPLDPSLRRQKQVHHSHILVTGLLNARTSYLEKKPQSG